MESVQATALGAIQGLTEFLPISSSGHLVLGQHLFGINQPELFFDIAVHLGTLAAVIIFFRRSLWPMGAALARLAGRQGKGNTIGRLTRDPDLKLIMLIAAGSVPTAVIGLLFNEIADRIFSSVPLVGAMLMITGGMLWATRLVKGGGKDIGQFTVPLALVIGTVQGLAILPGISRSGATIAVGLFFGLGRETAARYSFLLSIPAIAGAGVLGLKNLGPAAGLPVTVVLTGVVSAAVVGYLSLKMLLFIVSRGKMYAFAPYCWLIGALALIWPLIK